MLVERPTCSHCDRLGIACHVNPCNSIIVDVQYDLDSVLRFEQFTIVEDTKTNRGPKAVQLRIETEVFLVIDAHRSPRRVSAHQR